MIYQYVHRQFETFISYSLQRLTVTNLSTFIASRFVYSSSWYDKRIARCQFTLSISFICWLTQLQCNDVSIKCMCMFFSLCRQLVEAFVLQAKQIPHTNTCNRWLTDQMIKWHCPAAHQIIRFIKCYRYTHYKL